MSRYGTTPGRPEEYRQGNERAVKPKDAATLIIVRQGDEPRLLLGKRSMKHKFMPGKFVFPGGRLDLIDQRLKLPNELAPPVCLIMPARNIKRWLTIWASAGFSFSTGRK